ncbi:uncharacterized protein [Physcomitrium patens]|uniref:uncharacterized protein isoform X2 n=1 Tax=Physcomitrium patens TaxID=3218 RepID=UPI003CCD8C8F
MCAQSRCSVISCGKLHTCPLYREPTRITNIILVEKCEARKNVRTYSQTRRSFNVLATPPSCGEENCSYCGACWQSNGRVGQNRRTSTRSCQRSVSRIYASRESIRPHFRSLKKSKPLCVTRSRACVSIDRMKTLIILPG